MGRIFLIGFMDSFGSFMPVVIWNMVCLLWGTPEFVDGFTTTYTYQFLFLLICEVCIVGQFKIDAMSGRRDMPAGRKGIFIGMVFMETVSIIAIANIDKIGGLTGASSYAGRLAYTYGIISMVLDWTAYYCSNMLQYKHEDSLAFKLVAIWWSVRVVVTVAMRLLNIELRIALYIMLTSALAMLSLYIIGYVKPLNSTSKGGGEVSESGFSLVNGFKFSIGESVSNIFMFLTYAIGLHGIAYSNPKMISVHNAIGICTDTQWDIGYSTIDTVVTDDIAYGKYSFKTLLRSLLYLITLYITSVLMMIAYLAVYSNVDGGAAWKWFIIEFSLFPAYSIIYTFSSYIAVKRPSVWLAVLTCIRYMARLLVTMGLKSDYALAYGVICSATIGLIYLPLLYMVTRRKEKEAKLGKR